MTRFSTRATNEDGRSKARRDWEMCPSLVAKKRAPSARGQPALSYGLTTYGSVVTKDVPAGAVVSGQPWLAAC